MLTFEFIFGEIIRYKLNALRITIHLLFLVWYLLVLPITFLTKLDKIRHFLLFSKLFREMMILIIIPTFNRILLCSNHSIPISLL
jgi:hypothetical protein